ncbi:unnamed protein product [Gordionus sp. m RMFG-2023]|uniref:protein wntless homolog n=1 Tax=Gordionus sp. m RMFG-2023 TaxID=3053472 RepID=UPI0030E2E83F
MAGTVLERLSGKKLAILCLILFISQIICFLIGGLIAPEPSNVQQILATTCFDKNKLFSNSGNNGSFIYLRPSQKSNCIPFDLDEFTSDEELTKYSTKHNIQADNVIFVFQLPLPKDRMDLDMSRWFNSMLTLLMVDIEYRKDIELTSKYIRIEAKLAYRNKRDKPDQWTLMAHSLQDRLLKCHIDENSKIEGYYYNCSTLPFFELGNVHHDFYLVNLRLPTHPGSDINTAIGKIKDIWLVEIHQNGGFTRVWFSLKIVWFPVILALTIWFWNRVVTSSGLNDGKRSETYESGSVAVKSSPSLLEYTILALASAMTLLNMPVDVFSLWFDMPYMLFFGDIRQGIFYVVLFVFWIIFCGEHLIDDVPRNRLSAYWKYLIGVGSACIFLFVFELCERGIELKDPFFSIWSTEAGTRIAISILSLSVICMACYLVMLSHLIYRVFANVSKKRLLLPAMNKSVKLKYQGIMYRFRFLMSATCACAAMTVAFFLASHVNENSWKWDLGDSRSKQHGGGYAPALQYASAFYTGVYGMWNLYVAAVLALYAPSRKTKMDDISEEQECIEINNNQNHYDTSNSSNAYYPKSNEISALTSFLRKENID